MAVLTLDRPEVVASHDGDPIARLIVRPIVLTGPHGELADIDLMHTRRDEIEELILWSLHLSAHAVNVRKVEFDWAWSATPAVLPLAGNTVGGRILPGDDHRIRALRAEASEAIMAVCD